MSRESRVLKQVARKRGLYLKAYARKAAAEPEHQHHAEARLWLDRKGLKP